MTRILVIEDEAELLEEVLEWLQLEGYETAGAPNGKRGVELAREYLPDIILSDIMMPEMNGHRVLLTLRTYPPTALIPFIFLTARADRLDIRAGMELGADDYMTKPFTRSELLRAIETRLKRRAVLKRRTDESLDELRHTLTYALPHELRTPLMGILGYGELLVMDAAAQSLEAGTVSRMAEEIVRSGARLHRLIENYLVYAQLELWQQTIGDSAPSADGYLEHRAEIIQQTASDMARRYNRVSDLQMTLHDTAVSLSREHLKKLTLELVDNAFKFSSEGTPVQVTFNPDTDHKCQLCVRDHGRGMTDKQLQKVGAYIQFDRAIYEQQGIGLGLIIARRLAELYGGRLDIYSIPGQGTEVRATGL